MLRGLIVLGAPRRTRSKEYSNPLLSFHILSHPNADTAINTDTVVDHVKETRQQQSPGHTPAHRKLLHKDASVCIIIHHPLASPSYVNSLTQHPKAPVIYTKTHQYVICR